MMLPIPGEKPERLTELGVQVHVNVDPATVDVRLTVAGCWVQIDCERGLLETLGVGFTVTTTLPGVPTQALAVGVTK